MKHYLVLPAVLALLGAGCSSSTQQQPVVSPQPVPVVQPEVMPSPTPVATGTAMDEMIPPATSPTEKKPETKPAPVPAATVTVEIKNFAFAPSTIKVKKGDKIVFINRDSMSHTATDDKTAFDTGLIAFNGSFTINTSQLSAGSYGYFCRTHPNMRGTIIVE